MHDSGESPSHFCRDDIVVNDNPLDGHERFKILSYLGKGGFAECYSATSLKHGDNVALKIVEKVKLQDSTYIKMKREISIHRLSHHKNIVRMFDNFEDHKYYYLILELCNAQSLLSIINTAHVCPGYMDVNLARKYLHGILSAVDYLISRKILHRDIKPGNIFIGGDGEVKLGDFGLAIEMKDLHKASVSGTPNYLAPEILHHKGHSEFSEIWSIGCLLYCMMTGRPPFETESIDKTYIRISHGDYKMTSAIRAVPALEQIIAQCLSVNPKLRPRVKELLHHPWVVESHANDARYQSCNLNASPPQILTRAKSVGDMLKDANGNVSMRYSRPKSTVGGVPDNSCFSDKSRRKSITGSHDSGFGSEVDMSRRPALSDCVNKILIDLRSLFDNRSTLIPCSFYGIYISKWVDYSNRRGFACKLSDGTVTVKFNEGSCLGLPPSSDRFVYAGSPFSIPKLHDIRDCRTTLELELINTVIQYGKYMDKELAGGPIVPYYMNSLMDTPYLVFHHLTNDHLLAVLSNGTVQVNVLREKVKIVLWKDDTIRGSPCCISFLTQGFEMQSFRIQSNVFSSTIEKPRDPHLQDYLQFISTIITTTCDFISLKKPPLSTEC